MNIVPLDLSSVNFEDDSFFIGRSGDLSSLKKSISQLGLINPPVLRKKGDFYQIISGRKRLLACKDLNIDEIPSVIYELDELSDEKCLEVIYIDNKERISDLELAELIFKYKEVSELNDRDFIQEVLPKFGIPPSRKHYDRYLSLASLNEEVKNAFYAEQITIEQALLLSEIAEADSRILLNRAILPYKLNNNESRQVISDILDSALRERSSIFEVIDELESKINTEDNLGKTEFRRHARIKRFPELSKLQEKFDEKLKELELPSNINILHHPYFETNELEMRLKIKSSEELAQILETLGKNLNQGSFDELLSLILKGK